MRALHVWRPVLMVRPKAHKRAHPKLARTHPDRQVCLDPSQHCLHPRQRCGDGLVVENRFDAGQVDHCLAPRRPTAISSLGADNPATRSPRRCEQVMPAASMKARRPIVSATSQSQVALRRAISILGQVPPTCERGGERAGHVAPRRRCAPDEEMLCGEGRGGEQAVVVASEDRDRARTASRADHDHHAARAPGDIGASGGLQVSTGKPGPRPETDEGRGPHPATQRWLGIGQPEVGGDLGTRVGRLRPLA